MFFRFKQHASVKKNNSSKCHYHVVKHSELSKGTMTEVSTRQTHPVTSAQVFRRVAFQRQGGCFIPFPLAFSSLNKHIENGSPTCTYPTYQKSPPPTRVTRHSQSVRSSSKPCDLCGTAKLCREITVVALSTASAANGRRETGEVEHSGL